MRRRSDRFQSSNPAFRRAAWADKAGVHTGARQEVMTVDGAATKAGILLMLTVLSAAWAWGQGAAGVNTQPLMMGGVFGGLILALIIAFKPTTAPFLAPLYALAEGLFIGALSLFADRMFPGIVVPAVTLTFGTLAALLVAYRTGLVRATPGFRRMVYAATGAIFLIYMVNMVMGFFGSSIPMIHGGGMVSIGFSLVVVAIAAFNLVLDFDLMERGAKEGMPKFMEWYAAWALLVTLVWLYVEILHLLMKLQDRD
jgi:uncharacterized YccA/Bax inhibitor family protein